MISPGRELDGVELWSHIEQRYEGSYVITGEHASAKTEDAWLTRAGVRPYLLCAPHAVAQRRDGHIKLPELRTGSLAEALAIITGSTAVVARRVLDEESWVTRADPIARAVRAAVERGALVVDLHGMTDAHGTDVCLGLGPCPSERTIRFAVELERVLSRRLRVTVNDPFAATRPHTVTWYVQRLGGDGLQLELAARLRVPGSRPELAAVVLDGLVRVLVGQPDG